MIESGRQLTPEETEQFHRDHKTPDQILKESGLTRETNLNGNQEAAIRKAKEAEAEEKVTNLTTLVDYLLYLSEPDSMPGSSNITTKPVAVPIEILLLLHAQHNEVEAITRNLKLDDSKREGWRKQWNGSTNGLRELVDISVRQHLKTGKDEESTQYQQLDSAITAIKQFRQTIRSTSLQTGDLIVRIAESMNAHSNKSIDTAINEKKVYTKYPTLQAMLAKTGIRAPFLQKLLSGKQNEENQIPVAQKTEVTPLHSELADIVDKLTKLAFQQVDTAKKIPENSVRLDTFDFGLTSLIQLIKLLQLAAIDRTKLYAPENLEIMYHQLNMIVTMLRTDDHKMSLNRLQLIGARSTIINQTATKLKLLRPTD